MAAVRGLAIPKLALHEPPVSADGGRGRLREDLTERLIGLVEADHRGDAVALFQTEVVGMPADVVAQLRQAPFWPALEAMAHTLVCETKILGDGSLPTELAAPVETPTRVIAGGESFPYTRETALAQIIPDARARVLEGQTHDIAQHALASVLNDVFAAARWDRQVPSAWTGGSRHFAPKCFREVAASLKPA